jgi:hypothetical protein
MIQGLVLKGGDGSSTGHGVACSGPNSALVVIESLIDGNAGLGISSSGGCDVTVRRSTLNANRGGGMQLQSGTFAVTNTLIVDNGGSSSPVSGATISTTVPATFINNTVFSNESGGAAGVVCPSSPVTLVNSIITANSGNQVGLCIVDASTNILDATGVNGSCEIQISTAPAGYTVPKPLATGPCVNASNGQPVSGFALDHGSAQRTQGGSVDLGAFEVR